MAKGVFKYFIQEDDAAITGQRHKRPNNDEITIDLFWNNTFIASLALHYFNVAFAWYYAVHTAIIHMARYSGLMYWSKNS